MHFLTQARSSLPAFVLGTTLAASSANAVELLNIQSDSGNTVVSMGGYVKVDVRHVDGDVGYQDYWGGNAPGDVDTSTTVFNIRESRLNFKINHGEVTGFLEFDLYGTGGNEVVSNSSNPRIRHATIGYKNWTVGQTWTTFMSTHALPETLDFGGPMAGEAFIRQSMVRYKAGPLEIAIENAETAGDGDAGSVTSNLGLTSGNADADESTPDLIGKYTFAGDWGKVSVAGLLRQIDQGGIDETGFGVNVAGNIKIGAKDDLRFQVSTGNTGRYVGVALTGDIAQEANGNIDAEETNAFAVAYRHFWDSKTRSTVFYGLGETDITERERSHWGVNLITELQPKLTAGVELGQFMIDDSGAESRDSTYLQFSTKFAF